ncbi:MAG: patatin-like phospholipase family protein [Gemmatimonadales bacterium]
MADAMTRPSTRDEPPSSFNQVLLTELRNLRPDLAELDGLTAEPFEDASNPDLNELARGENLRRIYEEISQLKEDQQLSALCLSGGGIRSATFNLGVLQGLARLGLMDRFDYLSTVSGGGYIGGWLKAWMRRAGTVRVCNELASTVPELPLKPEPRPIDRLREFSNYLTPRRGLLSGDTWAAIAIIVRNLLLNWSVVVPVLMFVVGLPQLYLLALELENGASLAPATLGIALGLGLIASIAVHRFRHPPRAPGTSPRKVIRRAVFPLVLSTIALSLGAGWLAPPQFYAVHLIVFAALWCILLPLVGWSLREPFWRLKQEGRWPVRELVALIGSGAVGMALFLWSATKAYPYLVERPILYALFAVPVLLLIYLAARAVFVAFAEGYGGRKKHDVTATTGPQEDADREWWARLSGYVVMSIVVWLAFSAVALLGWHLVVRYGDRYSMPLISGMGAVSGVIAVLLGKGAATGSGHEGGPKPTGPAWKSWLLGAAAPLFCVAVLLLLAHANVLLIRWFTGNPRLLEVSAGGLRGAAIPVAPEDLLICLAVLLGFLVVGFAMGFTVNVNRFSLHGLYRNRLVRAYLGASNPRRRPDPFTGFAINDNLNMHDLWKKAARTGDTDSQRPLLVVNTTLNLVRGSRLAWQERKAESFSISPLYCGNFHEGYRPSSDYGAPVGGISLGTALTISGAAANPNMGYHSSPAVTFLLGILNARLGAWLGNTNVHGQSAYRRPGPRWAVQPLFAELLGLTTSASKYVQLSDGGHFDNLGLYEMVLRRCRFVVVSDAGRDPSSGFEDLGNAIRKIRIDFGISVTFTDAIKIIPRTEKEPGMYCAVGEIRYADVDGRKAAPGTLVYIKPTLKGKEKGAALPYDVFSYSKTADAFPHETTVDQWFDESQFESYRALGLHMLDEITLQRIGGIAHGVQPPMPGFDEFLKAVREYLKTTPAPAQAAPIPQLAGL